ncbi:MAG: TetR/AcrR family transcriptional regulator [Candidatus Dadabacteria bacterium]|nr:TetR/AcrR family transcriptional regulator [Candidatus Dadabacteria bacterium]
MNNREKLINVASELIHSHGFEGTSIDMIMRKSGVCRSNFYYYFESKEALGLLAIEKVVSEFEEKILSKTLLNQNLNPLERLDSFYRDAISFQRSLFSQPPYPGCFFGNLALEQSAVNEKLRSVLSGFFREFTDSFEQCLRDGVEQGFFREEIDPKETAGLVVSQLEGGILLSKVNNSIDPFESTCATMRNLIVKPS